MDPRLQQEKTEDLQHDYLSRLNFKDDTRHAASLAEFERELRRRGAQIPEDPRRLRSAATWTRRIK